MTTLLLPPDEVARIRALKGLAYVLAVMILLDRHYPGRGFRPEEVALIAGLDKRTVGEQLKNLSVLNRVILSGTGYVLTEGGRAMFLSPVPEIEALALSPAQMQALSPELPSEKALQDQAPQTIDVVAKDPVLPEKSAHTACALEEVSSNLTLILREDSTSTYLEAQIARALKAQEVFGKSHILFGETVFLVRKDIDPQLALSVFAHVYSQKRDFKFPARTAYAMMRDNKDPRDEFIQDPWGHLSTEYLEALNVVRYECNLCGSQHLFSKSEELKDHMQAVHPPKFVCGGCGKDFSEEAELSEHFHSQHVPDEVEQDNSVNQPSPNVHETPAQAWQSVLGQLQMEMHRAPFETWVRDTRAIRFDGAKLFIGARNSYTAQWLESRLRSTVERLLVGIMNQSVDVEFVVVHTNNVES